MSQLETFPSTPSDELPVLLRKRRWPVVVRTLLVFVCGLLLGGATTLLVVHHGVMVRLDPVRSAARDTARIRRSLDLDDRQTQRVQAILETRHRALLAGIRSEVESIDRQVAEVLTDEQRDRWHAGMAKFREHWFPASEESSPLPCPPPSGTPTMDE